MMKRRPPYKLRVTDMILAAVLLLICASIYVFGVLINSGTPADSVVITVNGEEYGRYNLSDNREIEIKTDKGYNKVKIESGKAFMIEADCPDKYCVKSNAITNNAQTIVCLPHRVVVELRTNTEGEVDVYVQ